MRLKFTFPAALRHGDRVDCVGWMSSDDLYSVGEDHIIYKYNIIQNELVKVAELGPDIYPLDMHWLPKGASGGGTGAGGASSKRTVGSDLFVLATSDGKTSLHRNIFFSPSISSLGKFCFVNKNGRIEKSVEAHRGATICIRWSPDGSQFATGL